MKINYPWKMYAEFEDGYSCYINGYSEEDCMCRMFDIEDDHIAITYYTGVCDEDYEAGEYIGRENFIYE